MKTATILARGFFAQSRAKTAHGLIRHGRRFKILSVIDETLIGKDAGEVMGIGKKGIPIVDEVDTNADILIIGVAPSGGRLPEKWRKDIKIGIENGLDIYSGLHDFLNDDHEIKELAKKNDVKLIDVRQVPEEMFIAKHLQSQVPVVLFCGTDAASGKRTAALEIYSCAIERGINVGFLATGQTGILIGCDAGVAVDHLPTDFVAGAVEHCVQELIKDSKELILVEGQGAILHHAYSTSTIGILHGAWPNYIILVHPVNRRQRSSFPMVPIPPLENEITALELLCPGVKVIAIALNCEGEENYSNICKNYKKRTGLPVADVIADKDGAKILLEIILNAIKNH